MGLTQPWIVVLAIAFLNGLLSASTIAGVLVKHNTYGMPLGIEEVGAERFLLTDNGIWRAWENSPVVQGEARFVEFIDESVWLGTDEGIWRVGKGQTVVPVVRGGARFVEVIDGTVWLGTGEGITTESHLFYFGMPTEPGFAIFIEYIDGILWLGTDQGIRRLGEDTRVTQESARFVEAINGSVWLGTEKGIWQVGKNKIVVPMLEGWAQFVEAIDGSVWLGTDEGIWRVGKDQTVVPVVRGGARFVEAIDGSVWLGTDEGIWRVGKDQTVVPVVQGGARFVEAIDGSVWLGTDEGIWRVGKDQTVVPVVQGGARFVETIDGSVWLGTDEGIWRVGKDQTVVPVVQGGARFVEVIDGTVWLGIDDGIFNYWNAEMSFALFQPVGWFSSLAHRVWPQVITDGTVEVRPHLTGPDANQVPVELFDYIVETDVKTYQQRLARNGFSDEDQLTLNFDPSQLVQTVHVAIRDPAGHITETTFTPTVVPGTATVGFISLIVYISVFLSVLLLAPYSTWCHSVLMNPFLRTVGSLGLLPVILTVLAPARQHVLKRYRHQLAASPVLKNAHTRYVPPKRALSSPALLDTCNNEGRVFVEAASGMGKSVMVQALVAFALINPHQVKQNALPVLVAVGRYPGKSAADMILAELKNHGRITDPEFAAWLLDHGNLLLVFDGLNEAPDATRQDIASFVEERWQHNRILVTSQVEYSAFQSFPYRIGLHPLSPAVIASILHQRLPQKAAALVETLSPQQLKLFARPQNLALAIERLERESASTLPVTAAELYGGLFDAQFAQWRDQGQGDYQRRLCERAYAMLKNGSELEAKEWEEAVLSFLLNNRIAIATNDKIRFTHDLLRAYLAGHYFAPRWRDILKTDGCLINENWLSLLEFTTDEIIALSIDVDTELRDLIFALIPLNEEMAVLYMAWLLGAHATRCQKWSTEFYTGIGQKRVDDARCSDSGTDLN